MVNVILYILFPAAVTAASFTTYVTVPDVTGLTQATAESNIVAAGLVVGAATTEPGRFGVFDAVAIGDGVDLPDLANNAIREASGLAQSRLGDDLFWINNDSGESNRIFAVSRNGADLGQLVLTGASAVDYEDIATGPGPDPAMNYIYIADVGDNGLRRSNVKIYRVEEPDISGLSTPFNISATVAAFPFSYPDGAHNCETLMIDPDTKDFYLVTKRSGDVPVLYRGTTTTPGVSQTLEKMGNMPYFATLGTFYDPPRPMYKPAGTIAGDIS